MGLWESNGLVRLKGLPQCLTDGKSSLFAVIVTTNPTCTSWDVAVQSLNLDSGLPLQQPHLTPVQFSLFLVSNLKHC